MEVDQSYKELSWGELSTVTGGVAQLLVGVGIIAAPFIFGAIAGACDEFARKQGHS